MSRQIVSVDEDGASGLVSTPAPPRVQLSAGSLYAHDDPSGPSTPVGRTSRTRALTVTASMTARPGSAPPQLAIYHQQRPATPPPTASLRPDSAPPVRPRADVLRDVREVGVGRPAAPHTFGVVSAVNQTTMPPPPVIRSRSCCPWVGPRVISGERFKFDLALRRRCCYCEGICNGILLRRRLVHCSWAWRHYTGATLWRRGKGRTFRALVFVSLVANLIALVATRAGAQRDGVVTTSTGRGVHALRLDLGWDAMWVWLEWLSALVLLIEVLLQWTASSLLPWFLDTRHLFRVLLAAVATASLFIEHVALRTARPLLILRALDMLPIPWFNALGVSFAATASQLLRITIAFGLLLALLTLAAMQLFGGVLRGRCLAPDLAEAHGWGVTPAPTSAIDAPELLNTTALPPSSHCLLNWRIWTTLGVLELPILALAFGTISRHVRDLHRRSKQTRWRRTCAGGSLAVVLQAMLALSGWLWFRNQCAQPSDEPPHCLDNWRVWAVLAAAEIALLATLLVTVVRWRRHGQNSVACVAGIFFSLILQPVLAFIGFVWFREICEAPAQVAPPRHCLDDWRAWAVLTGAELLVFVLFFLALRKREGRLERDREQRQQSSRVSNALAMLAVLILQVGVVVGGVYRLTELCSLPETSDSGASWDGSWSWSSGSSTGTIHQVIVVLTVGMDISECDEDFRTTTCSTLTSEALVAASQCTAWCEAGSVIVTAEIQAASSITATAILSRLMPKLADAAAASSFLGLDVETAPSLTVVVNEPEPTLKSEGWSSSGSGTGSWEESWSESESWSRADGMLRRLQLRSSGQSRQFDSRSSGSWSLPSLPPAESVALCDPYPSDVVNRCPSPSVCVDMIAITGLPNGHSIPSFDDFYSAAVATGYVILAPGWTNFYIAVSTATHNDFAANIFGCTCAVAGVIIFANVQLATVKTPVSAATTRVAIAAKRAELALLRKRVLGNEGHRAIRRTLLMKTSILELGISCCGRVTPSSLKRLRARLRTIVHDGRYQAWMAACTVINTVVVASTHSGMAAHERSIQNGLIFYLNLMFLTESALKVVDIAPDPFAKDQYHRGPARYLSSFDVIDLSSAIMVFTVPSGPDENVPMYALGALRCMRLVWVLATCWLPQAMIPLRAATVILIQSFWPLVTIWILLGLFGIIFLLVGQELLPTIGFGSLYDSIFLLLQAMNLEELPDALGRLVDTTSNNSSPDLRARCFLLSWSLVANGLAFSMLAASLADAGERVRHQEPNCQQKAVVNPTDESVQRPESARPSRLCGMIVKPDDVLRMLLSFGQEVTKPQIEKFFARVCEVGQPLRLPALLAQLEVDAAVAAEHVARAPTVHLVRNMLRAVRVLAIIDVIVEMWLWLGVSCLRAGAPFDCWVPTSPAALQVDTPALLVEGALDFPKTPWDSLFLCVTRGLIVTYAATHPRRWFGISGVFCDLQVVYLAFKIWKASEVSISGTDREFWWMVGIGLSVTLIYRFCACIFVYIDSLHVVAPRSKPAVDCLVASDRVTELVAAVRFFSLCDSAGKGHVTEVELRRVLHALNGGERGTDDVRFDAAFLSRDLMHQMDSAVDGKVYLHEFLQHASSGKNTPLTRLLLTKQMVRVLTAFTVADSTDERVLERSQLGRFFAGTGLHMSEDDLDEIFLQVELDHSGRVDLFELLAFLTATRELPFIDAVPPVWPTSSSTGESDPVQILKIYHEDEDVSYPESQRPKVTFAVPLDPRHVPTRDDEPEQLLPSLARGTRPFLRPQTAAPYEKPKPDTRWRPRTAPSVVLGSSAYNLRLTEWFQDIKGDGGRSELVESAMRKIYDKCEHSAQKALSMFAEIDVDGSGELDYEEFEQFLRRLGVILSEQQVQWLIDELDRDGDGSISSAEFMALVFKDTGTLSAMVDGALEKIFEQLGGMGAKAKAAQVFREIDKDDTGELSYEEFEDALKLLNVQLSMAQMEGVIQSLDQDGDGSISVKEFIDGVFGAKHASAQAKLAQGNSFMRVTVLEATLKHATDTLKYCLANLGGFPEGTSEDMAMGIAKQTGLSEKRPLDISQTAKDRFNKAPRWKVDERTKKPRGYTLVFEPEWTPASLEIQCFGGKGNTAEDQQIGQGSMDLDGLKTFLEWKNDEWVPLLDVNKKYAGRVRVKVSWHPYIPPEPEPEPEVEPVRPWAKLMLRVKHGWGFVGEVGTDPLQLTPYCIAVIKDEKAQTTVRKKSNTLPCDTTNDQLFWRQPDGMEDLWFELAGIPQHIEVRLMDCTHGDSEDVSTDPDRTLGHGFVVLADIAPELPEDKIWSKETEITFCRQIGEDQGSECGTVSVQLVWDPTQHEEEVLSDDEDWPTRRLRATVLSVRGLHESQSNTSLFASFTTESMGVEVTKMTGQTEPGSGTERDFPKNTRVDFPARRVPKEMQIILMDDSQGEIGSCTSTSLLSDLPRDERWSMDEWITLASSLGHECELLVRFHWEIEPHLVPDLPRILRITVLSGRQLAQAERYGENNPYVRVTVLGKTQQTETVREGGSMPAFADGKGEVFDWEVSDLNRAAKVKLECFDDDSTSKGDEIGTGTVELGAADFTKTKPPWSKAVWTTLRDKGGRGQRETGQIHTLIQYWDPTHHEEPKPLPLKRLRVTILSASKLPKMDLFGENDPYIVLNVEGVKKRTTTLEGAGSSPAWGHGMGERFDFFCIEMPPYLRLQAYDEDIGSADDVIGTVDYMIDSHDSSEIWSEDTWVDLTHPDGKDAGRVHCLVRWSPDPDNDVEADRPPKRLVVTVMSAFTLPTSDTAGKNDPYVIVMADGAEQRTPTVDDGGANVEWDAPHGIRLEFPFAEGQLFSMLKFRVMAENTGSTDEIGYCHFSLLDHGLQEHCWTRDESMYLSVTKNGKPNKSRARLNVKMAIEEEAKVEVAEEVAEVIKKPAERRLEITIINAEHLPSMDMFSENDVYCTVQVGDDVLRTSTIDDGGADPFWQGGSGEVLYLTKKVPPQMLDLKVWDCDKDEPVNWLTATVYGAEDLPKADPSGKNRPYALLTVDGQIQRTPTIEHAGANVSVEWGTVLKWQLDRLPSKLDVVVMDADKGSKEGFICGGEFEFVDVKMGRGLIPGVSADQVWEKEWSVQMYKKDGKSMFKEKRQPKIRVHFKWEPNVIEDDFIGSAMVPLGSSLPADQEWSLERATSIFNEKGQPAGTVHLRVRWNTDPSSEPMLLYGENDNSPQGKTSRPEPEPEPEPENEQSQAKVLSSGKAGNSIPTSIVKAMREAEIKRVPDARVRIPKDELGFEMESRPASAMSAARQPPPRDARQGGYNELMTFLEAVDVNGVPAGPRKIRPTSAATYAPVVHTEIIVDDDAQVLNPTVTVLAAIESVVTITTEQSGVQNQNAAAVPWRSLAKVAPALSEARSRLRAAQRWHVVQMYGEDADAVELHRKRHGLSLTEIVRKQRHQYRESLQPYQFRKPSSDWPSLTGGSAALICRLMAVGELTTSAFMYLAMLCLGNNSESNCWATSGGHMNEMAKPEWDSYSSGGIAGTATDTLVMCAVRTAFVLHGPSNPYSLRVAAVACCVGFLFSLIKMIAHLSVSDPPTMLHSSMFLLALLTPLCQLGLLYATYWSAKKWSIKLRKALSTDPLQEERERVKYVQGLEERTHYKFERFPVWCGVVTMDPRFETATLVVVGIVALVVALRGQNLNEEVDKPLNTLYTCCVAFFCIELVLRAVTFGFFSLAKRHNYVVDGALMPQPLLHTGRGLIDTLVLVVAIGHLLIQSLDQGDVSQDSRDLAQPLAPTLLTFRLVTAWWLPHLRCHSVRVRSATVVVHAWRRLLSIAAVLLIPTAVFAMIGTAEFGGALHRCLRGGGFADSRAGADAELFGSAESCEAAASSFGNISWFDPSFATDFADSSSGSRETAQQPNALTSVCVWVALDRVSSNRSTECVGNDFARWSNDVVNFDSFGRSLVTLMLTSHQGWFRLGAMLMQSAGTSTRQWNATVLLPPNLAVDETWPPRHTRTAVFFVLLGTTLNILLARLWLAVIWTETDNWERQESVKGDGRLPYQMERRSIRRRVGMRLATLLRIPELEHDLDSSESEEEAESVYSSNEEEEAPEPDISVPLPDSLPPTEAEARDQCHVEQTMPKESSCQTSCHKLSCGRCRPKDAADKYAMHSFLSMSKLDGSSLVMPLPSDPPKQHDRRFIRELSKYAELYSRISSFGDTPDLEQLTYAFNDEELRLVMRMNQLLVFEYVRDPKTGEYTMEEKPKPHKVALLHSNLHKLRPAGELRKSATGSFFERWPEVRPSSAEAKAQEQSTVRGAEMAKPRFCCNSGCLLRYLRSITFGAAVVETGLLCLVQFGRDSAVEKLASAGSALVTLLLLADTGLPLIRRLVCCQWEAACRAAVALLLPAIACADLVVQYLAISRATSTPGDARGYADVVLPAPRTVVIALVLLQIGHQLRPPGSNPQAGWLGGAARRLIDSTVAQAKALQSVFDGIVAGILAALPAVAFTGCVILVYASVSTSLFGHLWVAAGEPATALLVTNGGDDLAGGGPVSHSPKPNRFTTTSEATATLSSLVFGAPSVRLYSGLVWASCDGEVRIHHPDECRFGWISVFLLSFLFVARLLLLGVACVFAHRYRAVHGAATAAEEALRHVDVWCEVWHKLLLEGTPVAGTDSTRGRGACGRRSGIGCCASAASAPALLGTTLPCASLVDLLLSVPPPLGVAGAGDPAHAVRELLLGLEGLELRTVDEHSREDDENGNAGGAEALEFGCVLLAAVNRAARTNNAASRSAAHASSGKKALRQAFAVFFHDMAREKAFKDARELRAAQRTVHSHITQDVRRRPPSALKRPSSAAIGRPGSGIGRVAAGDRGKMNNASATRPLSALKRPGSGARMRPVSASSRPNSATSSRSSDTGSMRPVSASATMRPVSAGLGRLRPLSAQRRAVSARARKRAGSPRRVMLSDLDP